jgi:CheY-like chemotaxis protein
MTLLFAFPGLGVLQILLVEDSIANQVMLQRSIKRNGRVLLGAEPTVTTCNNGREALMELSEQRYDLVFMDLHMPIMGGMRAIQEIRKTYTPHQPTRKQCLPLFYFDFLVFRTVSTYF